MSVDPVSSGQNQLLAATGAVTGGAPSTSFAEVMNASPRAGEVTAATAAEVLNLQMLGAAVSLGDDRLRGGVTPSLGVKEILARFLEQLPQSPLANLAAAEDGTMVEAEGASQGAGEGTAADTEAVVLKASGRYGVDAGLIKAIIKAESGFNPRALSPAGAQGLMQLMPATARGLGVTDPFDPEQNVMAGTRFLKELLSRYGGNLEEALAAYNWGPGNVDRHGTDQLPRETRSYVEKVKRYYSRYLA